MNVPSPARPGDAARLAALRDLLREVAPRWLETRRWFADKGKRIASVEVLDLYAENVEESLLALVVIELEFSDGGSARYFLPLALTRSPGSADALAGAARASNDEVLVDATETSWFGGWLLAAMANGDVAKHGAWEFEAAPDAAALLARAQGEPGRLMRAEQSNSSLRFGDELIVKLVRRLQPGVNPDEEALRGLATQHFAHVPAFAGSATWVASGAAYPIALAQSYVPNQGDGWAWMLKRLESGRTFKGEDPGWSFQPEERLGVRTAELHLALSRVNDADFTPIVAGELFAARQRQRTLESLELAIDLLRDRKQQLTDPLQSRLAEILDAMRTLSPRAEGFRDGGGLLLIRVHGDYHLGQTLRTVDDDWTIIDFEGEPARPTSERRQRTSALKDVAGMLRSFAYVRGVAERAVAMDNRGEFSTWEKGARAAFLSGYRETMRTAGGGIVPADAGAFERARSAWELDKALYEIAYEARNRPDWLGLPLRALLPWVVD